MRIDACEREKEDEEKGRENDEPSGVGAAGELVNAGGNYAGLSEITSRKIVMPP